MKANIHPTYQKAVIVCNSCKTTFTAGSTKENISVEVCSNCHPFYTGAQGVMIDTANLVKRFQTKQAAATTGQVLRKRQKAEQRHAAKTEVSAAPKLTLRDMLKQN